MIRYTMRAMRWTPLAIAGCGAGVVVFGLGLLGRPVPAFALALFGGAVAGAVALSLDDPAYALVAAMPVGPRRRVGLRAVLAGSVAVGAWLVLSVVGTRVADVSFAAVGLRALIALMAAAVAVTAIVLRVRPDVAASIGAAVGFGWALSTNIVPDDALLGLSTAWIAHTSAVTGLGAIVVYVATRR